MLTVALAAWAMTVATATPTTPQPKLMTNQRSSTVLSTALTQRKYMLARLSPTARSMARHGVVDVLEDEAHGVDGEVFDSVGPAGLVRDAHEAHDQQLRAEAAEDGERGPQAGLGYEQRGGRAPELVLAPRAVELGDPARLPPLARPREMARKRKMSEVQLPTAANMAFDISCVGPP